MGGNGKDENTVSHPSKDKFTKMGNVNSGEAGFISHQFSVVVFGSTTFGAVLPPNLQALDWLMVLNFLFEKRRKVRELSIFC